MKMRFWRKTYIFTLILFLVCLNAGIFSLAYYTYYKNVEAAEDSCRSEQYYIAKSFERDYEDMNAAGSGASPTLLMQSYGKYYMTQNTLLAFTDGDTVIYSTFPEDNKFPSAAKLTYEKIDDTRYIMITTEICDGQYKFVYGKNVQTLDRGFSRINADLCNYCRRYFGFSCRLPVLYS